MKIETIFSTIHKMLCGILMKPDFSNGHIFETKIINDIQKKYHDKINTTDMSRYLWRSICQYKCQCAVRKKTPQLISNLVALLSLPLILFLLRISSKKIIASNHFVYLKKDYHMAYKVPVSIRSKTFEAKVEKKYLHYSDIRLIISEFIKNKAFYPELLLKTILWMASVRPYIDRYDFSCLIQYCEYSAHSSLRKLILNRLGIKLANVSHGEEFISCRSAFSSFDEYFAWNITPKSIHDAMYIEYGKRFTFNPCSDTKPAPLRSKKTVVGVLWPEAKAVNLAELSKQLNQISEIHEVIVRPHPNPINRNNFKLYQHSLRSSISDANHEDIHDFIDRCDVITGHLSAALVQASLRGRHVVYLDSEQLQSLRAYHEYYRKVQFADISELNFVICAYCDKQ